MGTAEEFFDSQLGERRQQDLFSSHVAQLLLSNMGSLLEITYLQRGMKANSSAQSLMWDNLDEPNKNKKVELNRIITEVLQGGMEVVVTSLIAVPRVF